MNKREWVLQYMMMADEKSLDVAIEAWEKVNAGDGNPFKGESFTRTYKLPHGAIVKIGGIPCAVMGGATVETNNNLQELTQWGSMNLEEITWKK